MSGTILERAELVTRLKGFKEERAGEYHLSALGFFGSYARDKAGADSDIDIVFDTEEPHWCKAEALRAELETLLGRQVDVVQLRAITDARMKARIERETVYV